MDNISSNDIKLAKTSKLMLIILRILLAVLVLIAILPWVTPPSNLGSVLLGTFGVPGAIDDASYMNMVSNFNFVNRILGVMGSLISLLPLLLGTLIMLKLAHNYAKGKVFVLENTKQYRYLGVIYLLSAVLLQPLSQIFFSLCVSINNPPGHRFIAFGVNISNITAIFFALVLIVIAQVMRIGQRISEEQELTI